MDVENFIYYLNTNNLVKTPKFTENQVDAIFNFIKAIVILIPVFLFLYKYLIKEKKLEFNNINDVSDYANREQMKKTTSSLIQGITFIILGIQLYFFFKPNNTQLTLGLLIKYLQKKKILTNEFYKIIKRLKPQGISTYTF